MRAGGDAEICRPFASLPVWKIERPFAIAELGEDDLGEVDLGEDDLAPDPQPAIAVSSMATNNVR
jgi:hypothetical protein